MNGFCIVTMTSHILLMCFLKVSGLYVVAHDSEFVDTFPQTK